MDIILLNPENPVPSASIIDRSWKLYTEKWMEIAAFYDEDGTKHSWLEEVLVNLQVPMGEL